MLVTDCHGRGAAQTAVTVRDGAPKGRKAAGFRAPAVRSFLCPSRIGQMGHSGRHVPLHVTEGDRCAAPTLFTFRNTIADSNWE